MTDVLDTPAVAADQVTRPRGWFAVVVLASLVGIGSTITQIVERVALAEDAGADLLCDINGTFSCGSVLTAWQSSVFGPIPNSAIGLTVFALTLGVAGTGLLGSALSKAAWAVATFFAGFMAAFTVWFLSQTAFVIGQVCLYCLVIGAMVLLMNVAWWRIGDRLGFLSGNRLLDGAGWVVRGSTDLMIWGGLAVVVATMMIAGLTY